MFSCWIQSLKTQTTQLTSSPSLLQSKLVEDPVAILQAAHSAAAKVRLWLQLIVVLVAALCVLEWCVFCGFRVWWTSKGVWDDGSVVSEAIPPPGKPNFHLPHSPSCWNIMEHSAITTCCSYILTRERKDYAVLVQLSNAYYVSLIASLSMSVMMHDSLQTLDLIWLFLFVVFEIM